MHFATLSKLGARKKTTVIPLWTTYSILEPPRLALGVDRARKRVIIVEMKFYLYFRSVTIVQQKNAAEETPFTRSTGELFLNSCLSSRVCGTPPSTSPINRSTPIYNSLQLEKRSLAFLLSFFVFFSSRLTLLARNLAPYLGQIAPVAVFTAREGARSVYPGVFGRAVLATLPISLPRPFLLLRAANIGPTVKTHCLFPPSLREPE